MVKSMDLENLCGLMVLFSKENFLRTILKGKGNIYGKMVVYMKEIGLTIKGHHFDFKYFREGNGIYTWPDGRIYKG